MIEVLDGGLLTTLQDGGRPGYARLGVGRAGAADWPAWRLGNALVGNPAGACAIEMTLHGPRLRLEQAARVALTGAPLPRATIDGRPWPMWRPVACEAGCVLDVGPMAEGCRSYLAVAGGVAVPPWLGSRATDLNAGLGPIARALRPGDRLPLGPSACAAGGAVRWSLDPRPWFDPLSHPLRLLPATHTGRLQAASRAALASAAFRVRADSNRVGVRLEGPTLALDGACEMVSEGTIAGVVQLPPGGQPIVLSVEHPVTGGYPRIAQLAEVDLPRLAQCRPGDALHFTWVTLGQAREALVRQQAGLAALLSAVARRLEHEE